MDLHRRVRFAAVLSALLGACAAGGSTADVPTRTPPDDLSPPEPSGELRRVVPTDERAARQADAPPPAISGGTLLVSDDATQAFVADPDRDRVSVVTLAERTLAHTIALEPGDQPGRLVQDDRGRVHVALRGGRAIAVIDPIAGSVIARHDACAAPRGIAFEPAARAVHVACASGELVTLAVDDGMELRRLALGGDLRDVIVADDHVLVSRFKSAELLELDADGNVLSTRRPREEQVPFVQSESLTTIDTLDPRIAWRTVRLPDGTLVMSHQLARMGEIALPEGDVEAEDEVTDDDDGEQSGSQDRDLPTPPVSTGGAGASPYGGMGDCSGVVQAELTFLDGPAQNEPSAVRINATLPVDIAISPLDGTVAVANAGLLDPDQPLPSLEFVGDNLNTPTAGGGAPAPFGNLPVQLHREGFAFQGDLPQTPCLALFEGIDMQGQAVAVAYMPDGTLLVQSREPDTLVIVEPYGRAASAEVALGGESVFDTGHEIFHRDPGGGVACASCHAEGLDDGHVWRFSGLGERRTQSVSVGLAGTAPFHWQGDMDDLSTLMEEVLVGRMGGVHQSTARASALQDWLFALQPPPAPRAADDAAAERGRALFEGQAECSGCHAGAKLTDNRTVDIGKGEPLQVPSLVGVAYRAPFMHDGCAATLRDRFNPSCGGAQHGKTTDLTSEQIDDLVAYLETL